MNQHGFRTIFILVLLCFSLEYNANSAPRLTFLGRTNSVASVFLEGESKGSYLLYSSTNLSDWTVCCTNTAFASQRVVRLGAANAFSFYQALSLPMPLFSFALAAKRQIDLKGNRITSDSFDSTLGRYMSFTNGVPNRHDHGDIAAYLGLTNSFSIGNADIWGHIATGPNGSVLIGPNGCVGDMQWHNTGFSGIEPGFLTSDMSVDFQDVQPPFSGGYWTPAPGTNDADGRYYDYLLGSGNYQMDTLVLSGNQTLLVTNNGTLYVTGDISLSGYASIIIASNACLNVYCSGATANLGGNGVINQTQNATNFAYWGLRSNTTLSLGGNSVFWGTIYAPEADFTINGGGGNQATEFVGSSVTASVIMNGNSNFHYDEALQRSRFVKAAN